MVIVLGIESTAHTFGVGIVKHGKILANVRENYTTEQGGIIPTDAAKSHQRNKYEIYFKALDKSGIKEKDIDAIAFSQGPGLPPCLLVGMKFAKELAGKLKKPLVPVNHCIAHLEIGYLTGASDPVMLYVSGANTQIIAYSSGKYRIFGETLDVGVGNFIDNFARYLGLGFPGGPKIQELAKKGKKYVELPYKVKGMDIALSGILTNLKHKIESKDTQGRTPRRCENLSEAPNTKGMTPRSLNIQKNIFTKGKYKLSDLAYSMQETVFAMLVETAERALAHVGKKELLLGGGVACNSRLQEMCKIMCRERGAHHGRTPRAKNALQGAKLFIPEKSLLVDNGAMIAFLGEIMFKSGIKISYKNLENVDIKPRQRTDEVEVSWK